MTFLAPFVLAAFIGAGLLFSVEPLVGKLVLPLLGGSPAVWNTCLLFFQVMLLTAYAYAHYGIQFLGIRRHAVVHTFLVAASIITLPPALSGAEPPVGASPVPWLLLQLVGTIGLPFFVLAATAPLVQRWLANSAHPSGRDPYFLYAASNLGSLAGLVAYPFVLEPLWGLRTQAVGWSFAYVAFGGMIAALALRARVAAGRSAGMASDAPGGAGAGRGPRLSSNISIVDALRWTGMAFVPSALLLAVTGYVTTDIAPMPLLWMAPLALYLATFVAAFGSRGDAAVRTTRLVQPVLTLVLAATVIAGFNPLWMLPLHFAVLTVAGYLGHARLAAERPMAARLTEFYLLISLGGTLGGVFGVLIAPLVLMPETEYALLLVAALLLPRRDAARAAPASLRSIGAAVAAAATAGLAATVVWDTARGVAVATVFAAALLLHRLAARTAGIVAAMLVFLGIVAAMSGGTDGGTVLARDRNFFGTLRVRHADGYNRLMHGRTIHGAQHVAASGRPVPTTYFAADGPLGDAFRLIHRMGRPVRTAVVGVGAGTTACHGRDGDQWDMIEIDPAVVTMALDPGLFTFVEACAPDARIIVGDGRTALAALAAARYDLLVLDAFSSGAIPAHMLTREAFELYVSRLDAHGVLAFHISNEHLDLRPVIAANALHLGLHARVRDDPGAGTVAHSASRWVLLAAGPEPLAGLDGMTGWRVLEPEAGFRTWTDDYSNLLAVLRVLRR